MFPCVSSKHPQSNFRYPISIDKMLCYPRPRPAKGYGVHNEDHFFGIWPPNHRYPPKEWLKLITQHDMIKDTPNTPKDMYIVCLHMNF
jgi:hypothetical protein